MEQLEQLERDLIHKHVKLIFDDLNAETSLDLNTSAGIVASMCIASNMHPKTTVVSALEKMIQDFKENYEPPKDL